MDKVSVKIKVRVGFRDVALVRVRIIRAKETPSFNNWLLKMVTFIVFIIKRVM